MARPVHLGLNSFADATTREFVGHDSPPLEQYAKTFGAYEMACTAEPSFDRATADRLMAMAPPGLQLMPQARIADIEQWVVEARPILESPSCGPVFVAWEGSWSAQAEAHLDAVLDVLWLSLPSSGRVAVEFRDPSWFRGDALRVLEEHSAALVWSTRAGLVPYKLTSDFVYIRLTGIHSRRIPDEISALVGRLRSRPGDTRPVYAVSAMHGQPVGIHSMRRFAAAVGHPLQQRIEARGQITLAGFAGTPSATRAS